MTNVDPDGNEQDLLLKSQSSTSWGNGGIEVIYDATNHRFQVYTFHSSQGWMKRGNDISVTFSNDDQSCPEFHRRVGARAKANGDVEVYKTCIEFIEIMAYCKAP